MLKKLDQLLLTHLGIFPDDWKSAKVVQIYKKNEKNDPCNYRPISVIPIIAKVLERLILNQDYEYFPLMIYYLNVNLDFALSIPL